MMATAEATKVVRWKVTGFGEKVYQPVPGMPWRAAGTCEKCGQGIRYVVTLTSTEGETLNVGMDCAVTLEGGPELADMRRAQREYERDQARLEWERKAPEREAAAQAKRAAAETNESRFAFFYAGVKLIMNSSNCSAWERKRAHDELEPYRCGAWTEAPDADTLKLLYPMVVKAMLPVSKHYGKVGSKFGPVEAFYERRISFETTYGPQFLCLFRLSTGESLKWKTTSPPSGTLLGRHVMLKGTIKAHDRYEETDQTLVLRCKVTFAEGGTQS